MTTTSIQPKKKLQSCLHDSNYLNKWTFAIFALFLLMATSVALAICFPYQGTEPYLRVKSDDTSNSANNAFVVDETVVDAVVVDNAVVEDNSINAADVMVINKQNNDMSTTDQEVVSSSPLQTIDVVEASAPSDGGDNNDNNNNSIGGLFGSSATATDEQPSSNEQAATATGAESDSDNNSSSSSCQMKLRLADANLDYIIDTSEYITFLQHFVGDIPLGTTQFDELESEYQVNFDHLAMAHTSTISGGEGGEENENGVVGIPIATLEEMQKVCVYISNRGSSAIGGFDWDSISSSPP